MRILGCSEVCELHISTTALGISGSQTQQMVDYKVLYF